MESANPMARLEAARRATEQGDLHTALSEYLWCFDHGEEESKSFAAVRLTCVVDEIIDLGRSVPEAIESLVGRRDALETEIRCGDVSAISVIGYISLNAALGQAVQTSAFYHASIKSRCKDSVAKRQFVRSLLPTLLQQGDHADVVATLGDPRELAQERICYLAMEIDFLRSGSPDVEGVSKWALRRLESEAIDSAARDVAQYFRLLLGAGDVVAAKTLGNMLIQQYCLPITFTSLIEAALAEMRTDVAAQLESEARARLTPYDAAAVSQHVRHSRPPPQ